MGKVDATENGHGIILHAHLAVGCPGAERDGSLWRAERFRPVRHERVADDAGRADHPSILGSLRKN